jgi:hypothetical protein
VRWGITFGTRALLYALQCGERSRLVQAFAVEGVVRSVQRDAGPSRRCLDEAAMLSRELADPDVTAGLSLAEAQCALVHLDYRALAVHAEKALELGEHCKGASGVLAVARYLRLVYRHAQADTLLLEREIAECLRDAEERRDAGAQSAFMNLLAMLQLASGEDPDLVLARNETAHVNRGSVGFDMRRFGLLVFFCQVQMHAGRFAEARARLEEQRETLQKSGLMHVPITRMLILHVQACALMPFRDAAADKALRQIVKTLAKERATGQALGRQIEAALVLRRGEREAATRLLDASARELAEQRFLWPAHGSRVLAAQARGDVAGVEAVCDELAAGGVAHPLRLLRCFAPMGAAEPAAMKGSVQ